MGQERRYSDEEIEEIFEQAARADETHTLPVAGERGPTLRDLQEIGREAGIEPQRIAEAAQRIAGNHMAGPGQAFPGMPVEIGRTIDLPRELTDREWELLVSDLREIIGSGGQIGAQGGSREWSHEDLRVLLEPSTSGQRLRIRALNQRWILLGRICVFNVLVGVVFLLHVVLAGVGPWWHLLPPVILTLPGAVGLAAIRVKLSRWAHDREMQMQDLARRARALIGPDLPDGSPR